MLWNDFGFGAFWWFGFVALVSGFGFRVGCFVWCLVLLVWQFGFRLVGGWSAVCCFGHCLGWFFLLVSFGC